MGTVRVTPAPVGKKVAGTICLESTTYSFPTFPHLNIPARVNPPLFPSCDVGIPPVFGTAKGRITVRVEWGEDQQESVSLSRSGEKAYAKRADAPTVCEISSSALEKVEESLEEMSSKEAKSPPKSHS